MRAAKSLTIIAAFAAATTLVACGSKSSNDAASTAPAVDFTATVEPIIKASCTNGACHSKASTGAGATAWDADQTAFKSDKATILTRIDLAKTDPLFMPTAPSTLTDANKATIKAFLNQ